MKKLFGSMAALAVVLAVSPALAADRGSSGRQSQARGTREIPRCTRNLGAIAIVEPETQWWREYTLGNWSNSALSVNDESGRGDAQ